MFDGVAGTTAVTLTANRTAAAAPIPTPCMPSASNRTAQAESWTPHAPSWAAVASDPYRGSRNTLSPLRTRSSAARIASDIRARRPVPIGRLTTTGARITTRSRTSGTKLNTKSFVDPEWNRSVDATMITPSSARAAIFSTVWETSVPRRTGNVNRMRPVRRAKTMARAGSPRRAGSVADMRTPIIVAEVTSRRRSGRCGSAARAISSQEAARRNIEAIIRAVAISTHLRSERTMLAMTWSRRSGRGRELRRRLAPPFGQGRFERPPSPARDPATEGGLVD